MITDMLENEDIAGSINRTNESIIKRQRRELKKFIPHRCFCNLLLAFSYPSCYNP